MSHDELCQGKFGIDDDGYNISYGCNCDIIAEVREDMLAKCIAALPPCGCGSVHMNCYRMYAVAALRALQEKP